ncbi:MAG TPA: DUF4340 domain-containing protein [Polyangiaceae bacterium]|jgi:hypothetical protein|nr:DUF4340 domain-containing protein [Polyangiaceae bacterium]
MMGRQLWVHVGLLVVAGSASVFVWTRDKKATAATAAEVSVWSGRPDEVQRITFESSAKKITLESRKDGHGQWFSGSAQWVTSASADAGATAAPKPTPFVSVTSAQKIAEALAPFKALRQIGRIDIARAAEFGLKEPASTLVANIQGKEHRLAIGSPTPSGMDRYVRDESSGYVYAAKGDFVRDLEAGETSLLERDLHDFQDPDIVSLRIIAGGKVREVLRRGPPTKRIWADPGSPDKADETVSNWLSKVDRLKPTEYVSDPPSPPDRVVRIEYKVKGGDGLFLELAKTPGEGGHHEYRIRSERTRLWTKAYAPWAEQVEQDLGSVLK